MKKLPLLIFAILYLNGCVTSSSIQVNPDGSTSAKAEPIHYSRYFEGETALVEGAIQLSAVAKINWRKPEVGGKQPDGSEPVNADIRIHFHNTTQQNVDLEINSVQLNNNNTVEYMIIQPQVFRLIPETVERLTKKDYQILNSNTEIVLNIQYLWNGKQISSKVTMKRLKTEELKGRKDLPNIF